MTPMTPHDWLILFVIACLTCYQVQKARAYKEWEHGHYSKRVRDFMREEADEIRQEKLAKKLTKRPS